MILESTMLKPMLNVEAQVKHLKENGVTFNLVTEEDAMNYLRYNNFYFKLTSYRKNYKKFESGENEGKYIGLDFGYLKDLAIVDMDLRYMLAELSFDIEHYTKIELFRLAEDHEEDGYSICDDFIESLDKNQRIMLNSEISRNKNSIYCGDLFAKYPKRFPMWVFVELIPFGRLVSFYGFCANRYEDKKMINRFFILKTCKDIRNAAAHSSCILNDLSIGTSKFSTSYDVSRELGKIRSISKLVRDKKLSNARIQQIVTLLYAYNRIVTSEGIKDKTRKRILEFKNRMMKNLKYYEGNDTIRTTFEFLEQIVDNWYLNV